MKDYVIGFGDNKVDYYLNQNSKYPGGNAVNFAVAATAMGVDSYYVGSIPKDTDGDLIIAALKNKGVDYSYCERIDSLSEKVFVEIKNGDRVFISSHRGERKTPKLTKSLLELMQGSLLVHSGCHANVEGKLKMLKNKGVKISFDFSDLKKYRTDDYLDWVCPNIYIALFSVANNSKVEINRLINKCVANGVKYVLLTRSDESPLFVITDSREVYQGFIRKSETVIDTMGAGDTYFSSFAINLVKKTKKKDLNEEIIIDCFKKAADNAYKILQIDGSFGEGIKIK